MMVCKRIAPALSRVAHRFLRAEGGNAVIEAVLLFPILFWASFGLYVFWDGYKVSNKLQKATYTAADIVSRWQGTPLTVTDAQGIQNLMDYIIDEPDPPRLRMTRVTWVQSRTRFEVAWSCSMDPAAMPAYTTATLQAIASRIPITADGGTQLLIESEMDFTPLFDNGIDAMTFDEFVPVRPRFEAVAFPTATACN